MSQFIGEYSKTCDLCLRTKVQRQLPIGEIHPLPVPDACWDTINVDFIVELPDAHGYNTVMNVVDLVSKWAHFIPTHTTITAAGAARLFLHNVWKLQGLPWVGAFRIEGFSLSENLLVSLLLAGSLHCSLHSIPPIDRWADREGQPGTGTVPPPLCQ